MVAGRVLVVTGPAVPAIVVDCLFLTCLSFAVTVVRARNHRNLPVAAVPALLGIANVLFHLDHAGLAVLSRANAGALMAGRVTPASQELACRDRRLRNPGRSRCRDMVAGRRHVAGGGHGNRRDRTRRPAVALGPGFDGPGAAVVNSAALLRVAAGVSGIARAVAGGPCPPCAWHRRDGWVDAGDDDAERPGTHGPAARGLYCGDCGLCAGSPGGSSARVRSLGRARCGVSSLLWAAAFAIFLAAYWPVLTRPRVDERPIPKEPANRTAEYRQALSPTIPGTALQGSRHRT